MKCEKCGSKDVVIMSPKRGGALGNPASSKAWLVCNNCGHRKPVTLP